VRLPNHVHPLITTLSLLVLPLSSCETEDDYDGPTGACFQSTYMVAEWGSDFTEECDDDITESTCEAWEYTDGTYDASTTFYEDQTCEEAGY
jgi:hypothetical protein